MWAKLFVVVICLTRITIKGEFEGDSCTRDGIQGTCININRCPAAIHEIQRKGKPQICAFDGTYPVVCCVGIAPAPQPTPSPRPVATPPKQPTREYVPANYDYGMPKEECEPVPTNQTSSKTGRKAWDKCIEYQDRLIYPCEKSVALIGGVARGKYCFHNADELIVGGTDADMGEFPHMVLLGFGDNIATAIWNCGGSLLSEWFILTAGHCTFSRNHGLVTYAAVGILRRSEILNNSDVYNIATRENHPQYMYPFKYNDIALLKTETSMKLGPYAVPACLDIGKERNYNRAVATGWGNAVKNGNLTENLQKVTIAKFDDDTCIKTYSGHRLMKNGFNSSTQLCYGHYTKSKDTCQGDSGGPLQVKNKHVDCMYTIIGVTSFGMACGYPGEPALYTKVEPYVPWIEKIVWA